MSYDIKKSMYFYRNTNIYTFSSNPLLKRKSTVHAYMPWSHENDEELMFKLKSALIGDGLAYIPFMDIDQKPMAFKPDEERDIFKEQSKLQLYETHLIMCNGSTIHIFKVDNLISKKDLPKKVNKDQSLFKEKNSKYNDWFVVSDVFIHTVNHIENTDDVILELNGLIHNNQTQNIFTGRDQLMVGSSPGKWVSLDRNVTYDYYIKSCELKDNVYQDMWSFLSHRAQYSLIRSDLERGKLTFYRGEEKWDHLVDSFKSYKNALIIELNELYITPLNHAIQEYATLADAWNKIKDANINQESIQCLDDVVSSKKESIETLEEFIILSKNSKSLFFSLKKQFAKKLFMAEHLLVENFLNKNETLFDSFLCRNIDKQIQSIIEIEGWISSFSEYKSNSDLAYFRICNSKLSHLLSIMTSASYTDNIFFKILEEKLGRGTVQRSFNDEVKSLSHIDLKKIAS